MTIWQHSLVLAAIIVSTIIIAAPECVTQSAYLSERYDYKQLRNANCDCPCQKVYKISRLRNRCSYCGHEAIERPLSTTQVSHTSPLTIINIQALQAVGQP